MRFTYRAIDAGGFPQSGTLDASSENDALSRLFERGYKPISLSAERAVATVSGRSGRAVKHTDVIAFVREIATLLASGVGLSEAFETLTDATQHPRLKGMLEKLSAAIHGGDGFSEALEHSDLTLPRYVHALAKAGEASGDLSGALTRAAEQMEFEERMRGEVREALTYPTILVLTGVGAIIFVFAFVVPRFAGILSGRSVDLPVLSAWVLEAGLFFNAHWVGVLTSVALVVGGAVAALRQPDYRMAALSLVGRMPVLSSWIAGGETARWTSILAALLQSRVPILMALELASTSVVLREGANRLCSVADEVRLGKRFSVAVEERHLLEGTSLTMVKVGEKSGDLGGMLAFVAAHAADRHRTLQRRLVSLIEPVSILVIGSVLGVIMVGIVLAMTSLTDVKF